MWKSCPVRLLTFNRNQDSDIGSNYKMLTKRRRTVFSSQCNLPTADRFSTNIVDEIFTTFNTSSTYATPIIVYGTCFICSVPYDKFQKLLGDCFIHAYSQVVTTKHPAFNNQILFLLRFQKHSCYKAVTWLLQPLFTTLLLGWQPFDNFLTSLVFPYG